MFGLFKLFGAVLFFKGFFVVGGGVFLVLLIFVRGLYRIKSTEKAWKDTVASVFWICDKH